MPTPGEVTPPSVDIPIVSPQTGKLTQYGWKMLAALVNRTGGAGEGVSIVVLKEYINQQLQDDREAPVVTQIRPPEPSNDDAPPISAQPYQEPDQPGDGLLWAHIRQLASRISHLEESR